MPRFSGAGMLSQAGSSHQSAVQRTSANAAGPGLVQGHAKRSTMLTISGGKVARKPLVPPTHTRQDGLPAVLKSLST